MPFMNLGIRYLGHSRGRCITTARFPRQQHTDSKENQIFLIYKEIQSGAVAKSYMRKSFLIYEEMRKYFPIYEEAVRHVWLCNCSILNFPKYEEFHFLFYQCIVRYFATLQMKGRWESNINVCFPFMYSQKWNCASVQPLFFQNRIIMFCLQIPALIYLWKIYICTYFKDRSVNFAAAKYVDQSWEYINRSQTHACRNWDWSRLCREYINLMFGTV